MGNKAFALRSKCSIFHNIFKYMIFQRCLKALLRSKVLCSNISLSGPLIEIISFYLVLLLFPSGVVWAETKFNFLSGIFVC